MDREGRKTASEPQAKTTARIPCRKIVDGGLVAESDVVAGEILVELAGADGERARLWASPTDLEALALGHAALEWGRGERSVSLLGREGRTFHLGLGAPLPKPEDSASVPSMQGGETTGAMRRFINAPGLWDGTGCFHRAGAYAPERGDFVLRAEDIGRHNCIDRLAGAALREETSLSGTVLFLSARVTASMLEKADAAGFKMIVSRSAVTTASVDLARERGLALAGFARETENRYTIFTDPKGCFMG